MNYLAHLFLSGGDEGLLTGNFIGDFVKGGQLQNYPPAVQQGIHLHRRIDEFTDHHALVHASKQFFVPAFDKYSGVLVDVFYDHILARHFQHFSPVSLKEFAFSCYDLLEKNRVWMPEKASLFYNYMLKHNLLETYADIAIIEKVLQGLTHRIHDRFELSRAVSLYKANAQVLQEQFMEFFPALIQALN